MAITPLTVTIDLNPSYKKIPAVYVSQLDNNLRSLAITVQDGGVNYDVASSGYDVYVEGTKPDKHGFSYKVTDIGGTVVGSVVTVPMQTQMTCVQGMVPTEIVLKSGSDRIGSANFLLVVERAGLAEDVDVSETDIPAYIDGAQQAAAAAEDAKDLAVAAKDTAVSVAASIPADYTTLSNDVDDLKSALSEVNLGEYAYKVMPNTYINTGTGNQMDYNGWTSSDFIPLTESVYTKITCEDTLAYNVLYDATKTKIKQVTLAATDNYFSSDDGAYIRFSAETAKVEKVKIHLVNIDPSLTMPYVGGDAKTIGDLFKRVVLTHNSAGYVTTLSAFTSDNTDDFNKINQSCFIPVVSLNSANKPTDFSQGFVLSVKSATGTDGLYQALYDRFGKLIYYRAKWAYGAEWGVFNSVDQSSGDVLNYAEAFRTVSVIGDSITVGYMPNVGGTGGVTNTDYSWQNYVFTKANITTCAKGGASAKTFFTDAEMNTALNNLPTSSQCVVIYLGTNPVTDDSDTELPYGTTSDVVASYDATPTETWVGYYTKLIKTVQHNLPNTPIIVVGLAVLTERNACIELSANACTALYVSAANFVNGDWNIADNNDWWHCTAIGYIGRANVMRKAINYAISQNLATFNAIQTIS